MLNTKMKSPKQSTSETQPSPKQPPPKLASTETTHRYHRNTHRPKRQPNRHPNANPKKDLNTT